MDSKRDRASFNLRGPVRSVTTEHQTDRGHVYQQATFEQDGSVVSSERTTVTRELNADGVSIESENVLGLDLWSTVGLHRVGFATHGASVARTRFDVSGLPIESVLIDASGAVVSRLSYRCGADGAIREAIQYAGPTVPEWAKRSDIAESDEVRAFVEPDHEQTHAFFEYDDAGRLISIEVSFAGQLAHREVRTYNDRGDVLTLTTDQGSYTYEYEYDHWGNWISKTCKTSDPTVGATQENRTIIYYGE